MTREEIVKSMSLQDAIQVLKDTNTYGTADIAKSVILKALEQEPMVEIDLYSVIKQKYIEREVLDKIRAEIEAMNGDIETIADVLAIFDKYETESEGQAN